MKNHSQLEESKMTQQELFEKKVGRNRANPEGMETPLGHVYSTILEKSNGRLKPDAGKFLAYVVSYLKSHNCEWLAESTDLMTPAYYPSNVEAVYSYMKKMNLPKKTIRAVMGDILGPGKGYYF